MKVHIFNESNNPNPTYAKYGDAGMDLRADLSKGRDSVRLYNDVSYIIRHDGDIIKLYPNGRVMISTGIHVAIPYGYELQIRPRSGMAMKHGLTVVNTPGTIDCGFKDAIGVILINHGTEPIEIKNHDRIAQAVLNKIEYVEWEIVNSQDELPGLDRQGGFGSTGIE